MIDSSEMFSGGGGGEGNTAEVAEEVPIAYRLLYLDQTRPFGR